MQRTHASPSTSWMKHAPIRRKRCAFQDTRVGVTMDLEPHDGSPAERASLPFWLSRGLRCTFSTLARLGGGETTCVLYFVRLQFPAACLCPRLRSRLDPYRSIPDVPCAAIALINGNEEDLSEVTIQRINASEATKLVGASCACCLTSELFWLHGARRTAN